MAKVRDVRVMMVQFNRWLAQTIMHLRTRKVDRHKIAYKHYYALFDRGVSPTEAAKRLHKRFGTLK